MRNCVGLTGRSLALGAMLVLAACDGSDPIDDDQATMTGGTAATGGSTKTGGMLATQTGGTQSGGSASTGGIEGSGGEVDNEDPFDSDNPARNDVVAGDVCDRLATLQCAAEQNCCDNPGRDFNACKSQALNDCRNTTYIDSMTENAITGFDEGRARAALLEYENKSKSCDITVASWGESVEGLRGIMQGTRATDASCFPTISSPSPAEGAAALASCADPENVACLPTSIVRWNCTPRADVGGACFTDINCLPGLYCPQDNYVAPELGSACAARLDSDESCKSNNECKSLVCKAGKCVEASQQSTFCLQ